MPSLVEIGPVVLEKKIFSILSMYFSYYVITLKRGVALHLNKRESTSRKDTLCQVWLKLAKWFLRRRFLYFVNVFWLFCNYLPLEKDVALHLNKLESPPLKDALMIEIGPVVLEKKMKMWKVYRQTDGRTDRRQAKLT